jgi:flagellin-like protein
MTIQRTHEGAGPSTNGQRPADGSSPADPPAGERAVSPVIGVALMIAVTVALAVIVAPVVFAVSGDAGDSTPDAEFGFSYDEGVDPGQTDTFGNTSSDVRAAGLMRIVFEDGQDIEAGKIEITGGASGGNLAESPRYAADDPLIPGEEVTVWVNRGDDVQIIWDDPNAGKSEVLAEFAVRPTTDLPVFVPDPDEDCDWVEDRVPGDLTVDGKVVHCDLSDYSVDDVDIVNDGAIIGDVPVGGDVNLDDGTVYLGGVNASGDLTMDNGAEIGGDVTVGGASSPTLSVQNSKIRGSVDVGGDVSLSGATVEDELDAGGTLDLDDSIIQGSVSATGDLTLTTESTIMGDASADTNISMDGRSVIDGDASADGNITLNNYDEIGGDALLADVAAQLDCNDGDNSLVNGVGCEEYKEPAFTVTIDGSNQPVEGDTMLVNATVENIGYDTGYPEVSLVVDGAERDSWNPTISGESTSEQSLTWNTANGDAGTYDAVVEVEDTDGNLHDTDTREVLVADDSRTRNGTVFEIGGNSNSLAIKVDDTVGYTVTATYDDGSVEDVTDSANLSVVSGSASNITIDDANNEITGDDGDVLTLEANDSSGYTDTVDLTVKTRMDDRTSLGGASTGSSTVTFDLDNTGAEAVEIEAISVDNASTNGNLSGIKVDNGGDNETTGAGGYVNTQFIEVGGDAYSFDVTAEIASGATETFVLEVFKEDSNDNNVKTLKADEVTFTLSFTDGTSEQFTIN